MGFCCFQIFCYEDNQCVGGKGCFFQVQFIIEVCICECCIVWVIIFECLVEGIGVECFGCVYVCDWEFVIVDFQYGSVVYVCLFGGLFVIYVDLGIIYIGFGVGDKIEQCVSELFISDELFGWLGCQYDIVYDFFFGNIVCFGCVCDLVFYQWCFYIVWVDGVIGDVVFGYFQGQGFGKVYYVVFGCDIGGFEWGGDKVVG